jgi:hypothetical protein
MFKKTLKVDYKEVIALQRTINLVLDTPVTKRRVHQNDMLRLMVIRSELETINSDYRRENDELKHNA